jgi:2-oxoglutarate dehydrogenase E1 component
MTVSRPSTPASYFHLLRWQALSGRMKPMIVFTPKSMLRLKAATSAMADFTSGSFEPVIGDRAFAAADSSANGAGAPRDPAAVRRVLLVSGKFYYDLEDQRRQAGRDDVALVRVERLYPLPAEEIAAELSRFPAEAEVMWAQEEPENMGAWPYMGLRLPGVLRRPVGVFSLPASSAPAAGSAKAHTAEHTALAAAALGLAEVPQTAR